MKKSILMLAAGALILATPACKKGEEDPFLSLSSRTGRIAGEWNLASAEWTSEQTYDWGGDTYKDKDVYTFDGTNMSVVSSVTNVTTGATVTDPTVTYTFSQMVEFEKDGAYKETSTADGNTSSAEGFWYFAGKSKTAELKKKEAVIVTYTSTTNGGNTDTYSGAALSPDGYMLLSRLTGKEMVVTVDNMATWSGGNTSMSMGTWTFEKE